MNKLHFILNTLINKRYKYIDFKNSKIEKLTRRQNDLFIKKKIGQIRNIKENAIIKVS